MHQEPAFAGDAFIAAQNSLEAIQASVILPKCRVAHGDGLLAKTLEGRAVVGYFGGLGRCEACRIGGRLLSLIRLDRFRAASLAA